MRRQSAHPMVTDGMWLGQGGAQRGVLLRVARRMPCLPMTALVAHSVGSRLVVAARYLADPVGGVAGHSTDGGISQSTRQLP
jgi:hypothetical protein